MKKSFKLILSLLVICLGAVVFTACGNETTLVTGVSFYNEEIYASIGEELNLNYKIFPNNSTNKKVTFWSSNPAVASVQSDGKVKVLGAGETSIVVRTVDGGYADNVKIITYVDPTSLSWDTSDGVIMPAPSGAAYDYYASMAINQVIKLKPSFFLNAVESAEVTNRKVKFTSSNPTNISVVDEAEGLVKAINNVLDSNGEAYSDIRATINTETGEKTVVCRVFINEYASLNNLYLNYKIGGKPVLVKRDGSDTISLTKNSGSKEFYAFILNQTEKKKTDLDMTFSSSNENVFTVQTVSNADGIFGLTITPVNEGTGTLYVSTTCNNSEGKKIRIAINIKVEAEIKSVKASVSSRTENGTEILLSGETFGLNLTYFSETGFNGAAINATRDISFDTSSLIAISEYVKYYGENSFKIIKVPTNETKLFTITGKVNATNDSSSRKVSFSYNFYIRNELEGIVISETEKTAESLPEEAITSITMSAGVGYEKEIFAYTFGFDKFIAQPITKIEADYDSTMITLTQSGNKFVILGQKTGTTKITFTATDGKIIIERELIVYIVQALGEIKLSDASGNELSGTIMLTGLKVDSEYRIYLSIAEIPSSNYKIETPDAISIEAICPNDEVNLKIVETYEGRVYKKYCVIEPGTLAGTLQIEFKAGRINATKIIEINL